MKKHALHPVSLTFFKSKSR